MCSVHIRLIANNKIGLEVVHCGQVRSQDWFWGVQDPKKWTFWTHKWTFLNFTPLPSYKNPIFGPLCGYKWTFWRFGRCVAPRTPWLRAWLWIEKGANTPHNAPISPFNLIMHQISDILAIFAICDKTIKDIGLLSFFFFFFFLIKLLMDIINAHTKWNSDEMQHGKTWISSLAWTKEDIGSVP